MINFLTCLAFISDPDPWQSQILFVQSFVRPCPASTSWQGRACEQWAGQGAELAGRGGNVQWEPIRDQGGFPWLVRGIVLAGLLGISIIHCGNAYQPTSIVGWDRGILMAQLCDGSWFPLGVWHLVDDVVPSNMSVDIKFHRQSYTSRFGTTCGCALFIGLFVHRSLCFCRGKEMGLSEKYGSPKSSDKP